MAKMPGGRHKPLRFAAGTRSLLCKVCDHFFGEHRQKKSSHRIYKTPREGDPRVNIQNSKGKAKIYQVKQVLLAIGKLEVNHGTKK